MIRNSKDVGLTLYLGNFTDIARFANKKSLVWRNHKIIDYEMIPTKGVYGEDLMRIDFTFDDEGD